MGWQGMMLYLCNTAPWIEIDGAKFAVVGQRSLLLRLLVLWPTKRVSRDLACYVLGIKPSGIATYVRELRRDLRNVELVGSSNGYLEFTVGREDTDACDFKGLV